MKSDLILTLLFVAITILASLAIGLHTAVAKRNQKIAEYELAFAQISNDMQINYGLQQGTLAKLRDCR